MIRILSLLALCAVAFAAESAEERIKGGTSAAPGEFPYQASIQINGQHVCGGALITARHVVTAASCLVRILQNPALLERTRVLLGTISLVKDGYYFAAARISIHADYRNNINDIGIVHLRGEAPLNSVWVKTINLPGVTEVPVNAELDFTGWGSVSNANGPSVQLLQKATLHHISEKECQRFYPNLGHQQYQICTAGNFYVGSCTTDAGGPLVYKNQLVGISTGIHGCANGNPDVFTKVSYYLKYILDEVNFPSRSN